MNKDNTNTLTPDEILSEMNLSTKDNSKDSDNLAKPERDSKGKLLPGHSHSFKKGNQLAKGKGRPIRSQHYSVLIEKHQDALVSDEFDTDNMTKKELQVMNLVDKAVNDTDLKAINWLAERTEGKVADQVILNADVTMTPLEIVLAKSKKGEDDE